MPCAAPFSGLIISNDYLTLGARIALREHGLLIPEHVSIVGFDDTPAHQRVLMPQLVVRQSTRRVEPALVTK